MAKRSIHIDQARAARRAFENGLAILRSQPLNCETPLCAQSGIITPNARFYVRTHFDIPRLDAARWSLSVGGLVDRPVRLTLRDVRALPSRSLIVTLECAGNGRSFLHPPVDGEQWNVGAVSTAEWTGVPLVEILDRVGVRPGAQEVVVRGADRGTPRGLRDVTRFERSLTLDSARNPDVLLAYAMNGEPLPAEHGYPLRVVVPGWYGMASVKWLTEIDVIDRPFMGHFQVNAYVVERERHGEVVKEPVTRTAVRALITEPARDETVVQGEVTVRGVAWSGHAPVTRVEVDVGNGWHDARLLDQPLPYAWRRWELGTQLNTVGQVVLRARASDASGRTQPEIAAWNRLGYGNNAFHSLPIAVVARREDAVVEL